MLWKDGTKLAGIQSQRDAAVAGLAVAAGGDAYILAHIHIHS